MIKKLRRQFVAAVMIIVTVILAGIVAGINVLNSYSFHSQQDAFMERMVTQKNIHQPPPPDRNASNRDERFTTANFYMVALDETGNITLIYTDRENLFTNEEIAAFTEQAMQQGKPRGTIDEQRFYISKQSDGWLVIFADNRLFASNQRELLLISALIGTASLFLLFCLSVLLAKHFTKPVQDAFNRQKQFISDASHELKTPISVIAANADVLEKEIGENKWLNYIRWENDRSAALVQQLLTLARLNAPVQTKGGSFSLTNAITSAVLPFESTAFEQNKTLVLDAEENITLAGEENDWKQIAAILLDNAFRYCPEGGTVTVKLHLTHGKRVLEVHNTGEGIKKEDQRRIFERFYRGDAARQNDTKTCFGLGLSIAQSIVERYGGKIQVESKPKEGARFIVAV